MFYIINVNFNTLNVYLTLFQLRGIECLILPGGEQNIDVAEPMNKSIILYKPGGLHVDSTGPSLSPVT